MLLSFNHESVTTFLNRCFQEECREDETPAFRSLTVVHICAYHALRRVRTYVSKRSKSSVASRLAVNAYRALLRTNSLAEAQEVVTLMAKVFGRKRKSRDVDLARSELELIQERHQEHVERTQEDGNVGPSEDVSDEPDQEVSFIIVCKRIQPSIPRARETVREQH